MAISSKQAILESLRQHAFSNPVEYTPLTGTTDFFVHGSGNLADEFKKNIEALKATCYICNTLDDCTQHLLSTVGNSQVYCTENVLTTQFKLSYIAKPLIESATPYTLTSCEALVARTGSVVVSSQQLAGRKTIAVPETHIVIAYEQQLYADLYDALAYIEQKYGTDFPSQISVITGPSRTADIEKTLVLGAHGPKNLVVYILK